MTVLTFKRNNRGNYRANVGHISIFKAGKGWAVTTGAARRQTLAKVPKLIEAKGIAAQFVAGSAMSRNLGTY